ncbi:VOC family protein [Psychrobacillus sp. FSL K6-4046]|uniref:VOC family protein n=1 Tax=Psychrobacillus sp. FSL K6-4046 TaxID=2921550 RepID=UPI003159E94A
MFLDHIVHFVNKKPIEVAGDWQQQGINAVVGGQHLNWGTYNALLYTVNSYVEWLAMEEEQVARRVVHPLVELMLHDLNEGPGFGTICIRANDLEVLRKDLENKGIETTGVLYAERKTAAGSLRKWKMLFIKEEVSDSLPAPFFIEWEETDDERYELLQKEGTVNNSNLQLNIESCEFHVENPREVIEKWTSYLNVTYDHQTLFLPNTKLIFKQLKQGTKERLVSVQIKGLPNQEAIVYEQGVYRFD